MTNMKPNEIEKEVLSLMERFSADSTEEMDRKNFGTLKDVHKALMSGIVKGDAKTEELSPFLRNFLEEFDNTYANGLPEAIISSLKSGKRADLTKDWWEKNRSAN